MIALTQPIRRGTLNLTPLQFSLQLQRRANNAGRAATTCCADGEACEHIGEMLKFNSTIRKLALSSNLVDDDAMDALAQGLSVTKSLTTLVRRLLSMTACVGIRALA